MQISSAELRSILEDVEKDLTPLLRSEREKLSKAIGDEDSASASASPMGEESRSAGRDMVPSERSGSPAGMEGSASASASPEGSSAGMPPEGSPEAGPEGSASAGGGEGVEALAAEYAKLPPEELEMHLMALEMVLKQHGAGGEASPAGMPEGSPAPAGMPPEASPAMKKEMSEKSKSASVSEKSASPAAKKEYSASEGSSVSKSEIDALNQKLDVALKAVEFLTRPMRKAVTEFASDEKPVLNLSKNEITAKLKAVTASPTLAKSDRQLINGFYDGRIAVDQIAHLLK